MNFSTYMVQMVDMAKPAALLLPVFIILTWERLFKCEKLEKLEKPEKPESILFGDNAAMISFMKSQ